MILKMEEAREARQAVYSARDAIANHAMRSDRERVADEVVREWQRARVKNAPMRGAHEGYAVLLEEVDKLWDAVKAFPKRSTLADMRKEAMQIAAMAMAFMFEVCDAPDATAARRKEAA